MRLPMSKGLVSFLMLGILVTRGPPAGAVPLSPAVLRVDQPAKVSPQAVAEAGLRASIASSAGWKSSGQAPNAFSVLWTTTDQRGNRIPMRLGRHRKTATAWGDEWENFGFAHLSQGHLGVGKDWLSPSVMTYWVHKSLTYPNGIYPDLNDNHNDKYVRCDEYHIFGHGIRLTTTVVVDMRQFRDGLLLGVKTAFQSVEAF